MRLSTKGRYGLKAMFELALNYGNGPVPLKSIADSQNLSEAYLEQLLAVLRKEGLVDTVRGAQGGYLLSEEPGNITVGRVIRALEGSIAPAECVVDDSNISCDNMNYCVTKTVWERIKESINEVIDSITLEDMVRDHKKLCIDKKDKSSN